MINQYVLVGNVIEKRGQDFKWLLWLAAYVSFHNPSLVRFLITLKYMPSQTWLRLIVFLTPLTPTHTSSQLSHPPITTLAPHSYLLLCRSIQPLPQPITFPQPSHFDKQHHNHHPHSSQQKLSLSKKATISIMNPILALPLLFLLLLPTSHSTLIPKHLSKTLCLQSTTRTTTTNQQPRIIHTTSKTQCPCHLDYTINNNANHDALSILLVKEDDYQHFVTNGKNGLPRFVQRYTPNNHIAPVDDEGEYRLLAVSRAELTKNNVGCTLRAQVALRSQDVMVRQSGNINANGGKINDGNNLNRAVIGAAIGGGATLIFIIIMVSCALVHNKRRRKHQDFMEGPRNKEGDVTKKKKQVSVMDRPEPVAKV